MDKKHIRNLSESNKCNLLEPPRTWGSAKDIFKVINLRERKPCDIYERESMEWYRQMRLQDEQWRKRHEPMRDIVFKEHDESYHRAVTTSAKARVAQKRCSAT